MLQTKTVIAGGYFILGGLRENEGAIITRDRTGTIDITTLSENRWYLLQTNQDHFSGDCPIRCTKGRERMELLGVKGLNNQNIVENVLN